MATKKAPARSHKATSTRLTKSASTKSPTMSQLKKQQKVKVPRLKRLSKPQFIILISDLYRTKFKPRFFPEMELTARHPYDSVGHMDFYMPGRWDTESDLVFMEPIRMTPQGVTSWTGTVGYITFKAASSGTYMAVANFSGFDITMRLSGPWGATTAYTAETSDAGVVTALWTGTAGGTLAFQVSCTGAYLGYLQSIQVFKIS